MGFEPGFRHQQIFLPLDFRSLLNKAGCALQFPLSNLLNVDSIGAIGYTEGPQPCPHLRKLLVLGDTLGTERLDGSIYDGEGHGRNDKFSNPNFFQSALRFVFVYLKGVVEGF